MKSFGLNCASLLIALCLPSWSAVEPDMQVTFSSSHDLTIEFSPRNWQTKPTSDNRTIVSFEGAEMIGEMGAPLLPVRTVTVGVPLEGEVSVQVVDSEYDLVEDIRLQPVSRPVRDDLGLVISGQAVPDDSLYSLLAFYPQNTIQAEPPSFFRRQRVVRLTFQPLQFSPQRQQIRRYRRIVVRFQFSPAARETVLPPEQDETLYRDLLLNYQQAKNWRRIPQRLRKPTRSAFQGTNWYQLAIRLQEGVQQEGIYKVDGTTLEKAGISLSAINPATVQLFNNGGRELPMNLETARPDSLIENPIYLVGGEDGRFDRADYFLFYGRSVQGTSYDEAKARYQHHLNAYTDENIYWLTFNAQPGKRMAIKPAPALDGIAPESSFRDLVFHEKEQHNVLNSGFVWFGQQLTKNKASYSLSLEMPEAIPDSSAELRLQLAATTAGTHTIRTLVNGFFVYQATINGASHGYGLSTSSTPFKGVLLDGANTLSLQYQSTSEISIAYVDWIEIEYNRRFRAVNDQLLFNAPKRAGTALYHIEGFSRNDIEIYDVSNPNTISRLSDYTIAAGQIRFSDETNAEEPKRYIALTPGVYRTIDTIQQRAVTDLRSPRTADYIVITHDDFYQQALELKSLHETFPQSDRLRTEVVRISDVYDQFSWGLPDVTATRDFLVYAQENWGAPQYVLLFGDGHFDYKNILGYRTPNLILPYETTDRYETSTRTTDDWFTYTKPNSGMQMAIGRIPVQSVAEAQNYIQKLVRYVAEPEFGEWRKHVTIVSDDELVAGGQGNLSDTIHTTQSESLAEGYVPDLLDVKKLYLMEYPAVRNASVSGVTKPSATEDLLNQINRGSLLINYIGHGNDELWSHERVLNSSTDFERIQNGNRMAVWVAATCEFAYWDQPQKQSFAERILLAPNRGAIAMISSSRLAYSNYNAAFNYALYNELFRHYSSTGQAKRLGDAVLLAKRSSSNMSNSEKYILLGDPAMRLGAPQHRAVFDQIQPDSIQALSVITLNGHIERNQELWSDYSGQVLVRVIDSRRNRVYTTDFGSSVHYALPGNSIFRGIAAVEAGQFQVRLIVPKDISYGGTDGRISAYFWNDETEGTGNRENLPVGGTAASLIDHEGPEITLHFGKSGFTPGDYTTTQPTLYVEIADSLSGVNIAGDIGHQITLTLNENDADIKDLTDFFEYDPNSYTRGSLRYPLYNLPTGRHDVRIKAWDNSNNSSIQETHFIAVADSTLRIRNLLSYPNPMSDQTAFTFEISRNANVRLKIFAVSGRLVRQFDSQPAQIGFNIFPQTWDGTDQDGDPLANGVYLYKLHARSTAEGKVQEQSQIGKIVIAR
ncbi:type IX secretion system sortase PorU [candidate division KSB1 bacterium]|nr:type IX secretion system sortase PorU [candidate division KSB1 bacterium]